MLTRCFNKKNKSYEDYGGRGITVCAEWLNFEAFYRDMGEKPLGYQLDRKDNEKGYSKENCHWVTPTDNANNRRSCRMVNIDGRRQSLTKWAKEYGINPKTVANRVRKLNWSVEKALTAPVRQKTCRSRH